MIALIGVVLLIGIVKKNAIMMIDFALEAERVEKMPPEKSIYQACLLRFRPIMMTTAAALLGALPLALETGTGSELRRPMGISIVGGLLLSQFLTLYTTPVIYLYMDRLEKRVRHWRTSDRPVERRRTGTPTPCLCARVMNVSEPFIRRPAGTSLLAAGLFLLGIVAYHFLPVAAIPRVDYPIISVSASLPGAEPPPSLPRWPLRWNAVWPKSPACRNSLPSAPSVAPRSPSSLI